MAEGMITRSLDADHAVVTWDRVLIQVWRLGITPDAITDLERVARSYASEQPGGKISSISIIERTSPPPPEHVRKDLSRFYKNLAPQLHEAIIVAEGGGFRAALVRGVGVALSSLAPKSLPFKFVDTIRSASITIGPHLSPGSGGASELEAVVERVRTMAAGVGEKY